MSTAPIVATPAELQQVRDLLVQRLIEQLGDPAVKSQVLVVAQRLLENQPTAPPKPAAPRDLPFPKDRPEMPFSGPEFAAPRLR